MDKVKFLKPISVASIDATDGINIYAHNVESTSSIELTKTDITLGVQYMGYDHLQLKATESGIKLPGAYFSGVIDNPDSVQIDFSSPVNFDDTVQAKDVALSGNLNVTGDLIVQGSTNVSVLEEIVTDENTIRLRNNAQIGLLDGTYTGIIANKYDGENTGVLVFDNSGTAYVGDEQDVQPLATRMPEAEMKNGSLVKWNADTFRLENGLLAEETHIKSLKLDANNIAGAKGVYFAEIHPTPEYYTADDPDRVVTLEKKWDSVEKKYYYHLYSDDYNGSILDERHELSEFDALRMQYYFFNPNEAEPYVVLSDNQFAPASEGFTMPEDWAVGDHLTILDWFNYDYCSVITRIYGNRVYCDYIPETEEQYATVINCDLDKLVVNIDKPQSGLIDAGYNAVVLGEYNTSILQDAFVNGLENTALGKYAFVTGRRNKAGYACAVFGNNNNAFGEGHMVTGCDNDATGERNFVGGIQSNSDGRATMAFGIRASATGESQTVVGKDNIVRNDAYFIVGNGANSKSKSNAIVVNTAGGIELGKITGKFIDVNGTEQEGGAVKNALALNNLTRAQGEDSLAQGKNTVASGTQAVALGKTTEALGNCSISEGYYTRATASCAHAAGKYTTASGSNSYAGGVGCQATEDSQFVIGRYNAIDQDAYFIVGNGSEENPQNALTVTKHGTLYLDGIGISKNQLYTLKALDIACETEYEPVTMIDFVLECDGDCEAEEGMTWTQWVNSEYNTTGVFIAEGAMWSHEGYWYTDQLDRGPEDEGSYLVNFDDNYFWNRQGE